MTSTIIPKGKFSSDDNSIRRRQRELRDNITRGRGTVQQVSREASTQHTVNQPLIQNTRRPNDESGKVTFIIIGFFLVVAIIITKSMGAGHFNDVVSEIVPTVEANAVIDTSATNVGTNIDVEQIVQNTVLPENTQTGQSKNQPTAVSVPHLWIKLKEGRDEERCISIQIVGIDSKGWYLAPRGFNVNPAVFDGAGNARMCEEFIGSNEFVFDIYDANGNRLQGGSAPARNGDIFIANWMP